MTTTASQFSVNHGDSPDPSIAVIALGGQLDAHTAPEFERFLEQEVRDKGNHKIVLDFSALEYISSAGLGVLMGFIEDVRSDGGDMKFASVPEKIYHVLDLLGFPVVFTISPTIAEAVASFEHHGV